MSDCLTKRERIQFLERELNALKSEERIENITELKEAIFENERKAATLLEDILAQKAELAGLCGDEDVAQEVITAADPKFKVISAQARTTGSH